MIDSANETEKNERVLHARIPKSLERELRNKASALGMSVSNLVRNILNNAVDLVEDVIADSSAVAHASRGATPRGVRSAPGALAPRVLGWNTSILNVNASCARCDAVLSKGGEAAIAVLAGPGEPEIICLACRPQPNTEDTPDDR